MSLKNTSKAKDLCFEALNIINYFINVWPLAKKYKTTCLNVLQI